MTGALEARRRILIGAGCYADALGAIRLVDRIAESLASELGGVLVEEAICAELSEMPKRRVRHA